MRLTFIQTDVRNMPTPLQLAARHPVAGDPFQSVLSVQSV